MGFLVCRTLTDKELFLRRCIANANDGRGYVIPLDDHDLAQLVADRINQEPLAFPLLRSRFNLLVDE